MDVLEWDIFREYKIKGIADILLPTVLSETVMDESENTFIHGDSQLVREEFP